MGVDGVAEREENTPMASGSTTDEELADLVRRTEDAASAYMRWDVTTTGPGA